jgi:tripartite-type tricarboxylate transporter receptor subunit TctC
MLPVTAALIAACSTGGSTSAPASAAPTAAAPSEAAPSAEASGASGAYEYVDGVLQPLADGFPNRPIELLNGDEAGSDDGLYVRTLQACLRDVSPVPIEVVDRPGPTYGAFTMAEFMNQTEEGRDGYQPAVIAYIGGAQDVLTQPIERDLGLTIKDINPIVAHEVIPWLMSTRVDAPWGDDFNAMIEYGKQNPNSVRFAHVPGSGVTIATMALFDELGFTYEPVVQSGGSNVAVSTVAAGETDVVTSVAGIAKTHLDAGKIKLRLAFGDFELAGEFADVPNTADIGKPGLPWASVRGLFTSQFTPVEHRDWLFELFKNVADCPEYDQRISTLIGGQKVLFDPAQSQEVIDTALELSEPIIRKLGLHWEDQ